MRLHIGCGPTALHGWLNIDNQPYPGVDRVLDITEGLPLEQARFVFAEHFIEHLELDAALGFLRECRRVLAADGVLRLSTPNLDWVWMTQYHFGSWSDLSEAVRDCFWMNKSFRGWGHRFLYNAQTLAEMLRHCGFGEVESCRYGESRHAALRDLERHEKYPDAAEFPHVIVLEAHGESSTTSTLLSSPLLEYREALGAR